MYKNYKISFLRHLNYLYIILFNFKFKISNLIHSYYHLCYNLLNQYHNNTFLYLFINHKRNLINFT